MKDGYAPQSKGMGDTSACDAAALTPEGHPSSSFLKQLIAATLHTSGSYSQNKNNTVTHHSHHPYPSQLGRNICAMSQEPLKDSQDVRIINLESDYWKNFEEEVMFNSG